jgi:transglycosylase-like protein with SLT domain
MATATTTPTSSTNRSSGTTPTPTRVPPGASTDSTAEQSTAALPQDNSEIEAAADWQAFVPTDTADHLATMDRAARDSGCGVPWQLLAAIARVESDFGRNMATSSAGAIGYGQFLPSSWQAFGSDGNAYDYRDALPAIALYLCAAGLSRDPRAALFAYNHADWYVDLVLDLAVRYDRLAPGAPTPDVLAVGPLDQAGQPIHYASGRDARLQAHARTLGGGVNWLGVPWHGRAAGEPISARGLESSVIAMLRSAFGRSGDPPPLDTANVEDLIAFGNAAWDAGLPAVPGASARWSLADIRRHVHLGHPVVVVVNGLGLPGHPPGVVIGDQPLLVIGTTTTGLIYSDPSFSSSLGYGLELSDVDFENVWDAAAEPRRALAFTARPRPDPRQAHVRIAEPPDAIARVLPTVTAATVTPEPPTATPAAVPTVNPTPVRLDVTIAPAERPDASWITLVGAGVLVAGAFALRRLRLGPNFRVSGSAAAAPRTRDR